MTSIGSDAILELDRRHVWHPYDAMPARTTPLLVESAEGTRLRLSDGRELVDGMASWWSAIHGYHHPALDVAATTQLDRMAHVMFGGLTHEPAVRLAERVVAMTPGPLQHVFFADSGSVAVEVAIKMVLQHWRADGNREKRRLLTWRGGYHGDTFGAMAVCDPETGMHSLFTGALASQLFASAPPGGFAQPVKQAYAAELESLFERHADELAAVIVEPVVQGAGGMRFHNPAYLTLLRELCDAHRVLLVLDEIATGFGRTGALFACEHARVTPDVLCLGKALTGGYLTLAATLCTTEIATAISAGDGHALMHGPTFMANPLACSVALASLSLLAAGDWRDDVRRIERAFRTYLEPVRSAPGVADARVLGAIGVIQLDRPVDVEAATHAAVEHGVWLRPFGDLVYAMPPYVTTDDELQLIAGAMLAAAAAALSTPAGASR